MKAALQSRMQIEYRVLLVTSILTLSVCLIGQPAMRAAEASPTTAKESSKEAIKDKDQEEDEDDDTDSKDVKKDEKKEEKSETSASKSTNGKADHKEKESTKHSSSSDDSKSKTTATKHESEKAKGEKVRVAMLTLKDSLPESAEQAGPFGENKVDMREITSRLEKAAKDKTIAGLILDIQNPTIGRGKVDELRGAISRFRKSGKKVYAMMDSAEPSDYLVACACDEIVMPETGVVTLPGVHAEATFYRGLLAKLGVEADFIHIGDYKGYAEPYTRDKFSEPVRENMTKLIDDLYDDMVTTIVKDRPLTISQAKEIIDTGMVTAGRAKELGLIDRVAYPDDLRAELAKKYKAEPLAFVKNYGKKEVDTDFSGPMGFFKLMQAMMGGESSTSERKGKKIAVIYCLGPIATGKSESSFTGEE
jgi:protease-4